MILQKESQSIEESHVAPIARCSASVLAYPANTQGRSTVPQ